MKRSAILGLVAMIPAALAPGLTQAHQLTARLCTGDGPAKTVTIPVVPGAPGNGGDESCCAKGCHAGGSRKRGSCHI